MMIHLQNTTFCRNNRKNQIKSKSQLKQGLDFREKLVKLFNILRIFCSLHYSGRFVVVYYVKWKLDRFFQKFGLLD